MSEMTSVLYPIYFTLSVVAISFLLFFRQRVEVGLWVGVLALGCIDGKPTTRWHSKHDRLAVSELFLYLLLAIS